MKRNLILIAAFIFLIAVSTTFAQQKTDNFLGTWKLSETGNKPSDKSGLKSLTITVSENNGKLKIERNGQNLNDADLSSTEAYKINEDTETSVIGGFMGGVEFRRLRVLKSNKLQFLTTLKGDYSITTLRATWIISGDGKTLTIKRDYITSSVEPNGKPGAYISSKLVFTKQ
jgi:hypothetical protein